ncbi:MAG TPA: Fur family transcriptional regulator [Acidimicrobiales bacterium]|nr:Fur family transcriptional regulator [Acidimicrobiales bacterium]
MPASAPPRTPAELDREVGARVHASGQRYTANRQAVVRILADADRPLTTAEVVSAGDGLAQSSVYRNLSVLEAAGVVLRIAGGDEFTRFELAEDLAGHHHHLICLQCGAVADFTVPADVETALEAALARVARSQGFSAEHHRLDLVGRCAACA